MATFLAGYGLQLLIGMAGYALLMKRWRMDATVSFVLVTGVTAAFSLPVHALRGVPSRAPNLTSAGART